MFYSIYPSIHTTIRTLTTIMFLSILQDKKNSLSVANLINRTTSPCESFHSAMNRSIPKHANFFVFVDGVKLYESRKSDEFYNAILNKDSSNLNKPRHTKYQELNEKIEYFTKLIIGGTLSTEQFLEAMAEDDQCKQKDIPMRLFHTIHTSIHPHIYPSIHLSIHISIHPAI